MSKALINKKKLNSFLCITDFPGCDPTGATDSDAALLAAYNKAAELLKDVPLGDRYGATIYFPPGNYVITTNNFLGQVDFTGLSGGVTFRFFMSFEGAGYSSIITWRPSSSTDVWMYDGGTSGTPNNSLVMPSIKNMYIKYDSANMSGSGKMNGIRLWSGAAPAIPQQGLELNNVYISCIFTGDTVTDAMVQKAGTFLRIDGLVNSDLTSCVNVRVEGYETFADFGPALNSVSHTFTNCSALACWGDVFKIEGGGPPINVFGGAWSLWTRGPNTKHFLAINPGNTAAIGHVINFYGITCELDQYIDGTGAFGAILLIDATGTSGAYSSEFFKVNFDNCSFQTDQGATGGTARDVIKIDAANPCQVVFRGCKMNGNYQKVNCFSSKANLATSYDGPFAQLSFVDGDALSFDVVSFDDTNSLVTVSARNCSSQKGGSPAAPNALLDYDISANGFGQYVLGKSRPRKTATIYGSSGGTASWPHNGANTGMAIKLPPYALLVGIRFHKKAQGAETTTYQLYATDNSATPVYARSVSAAYNVKHEAYVEFGVGGTSSAAIPAPVLCSTDTKQYVNIIAVAGATGGTVAHPMTNEDYVIVDYY